MKYDIQTLQLQTDVIYNAYLGNYLPTNYPVLGTLHRKRKKEKSTGPFLWKNMRIS